jgi:hypothetical protein
VINSKEDPVVFGLWLYELEDAKEHLEQLIKELTTDSEFGEAELAISLGHVYAHLNRAWNSRNTESELTEEQWNSFREFPKDLKPLV